MTESRWIGWYESALVAAALVQLGDHPRRACVLLQAPL
jgi:hypothetical protein